MDIGKLIKSNTVPKSAKFPCILNIFANSIAIMRLPNCIPNVIISILIYLFISTPSQSFLSMNHLPVHSM